MLDFEKKAFESQYKDYKRRYLEADKAYQEAKNDVSIISDSRYMHLLHTRDMWGSALADLILEHEGDILTCLLPETESDSDELPFM